MSVAKKSGVVGYYEDEYTVSKLKERTPAGVWIKRVQRRKNPTPQGVPMFLILCVSEKAPALLFQLFG